MRQSGDSGTSEIDDYLAKLPAPMRAALQRLRKTIRAAVPGADEVTSYGIPAFRQGRVLVHYAAFEDHCSFFAGYTPILPKFIREVKPFLSGKTTLRFTPQRPIPPSLVKRIVRERLAATKSKTPARSSGASRPR